MGVCAGQHGRLARKISRLPMQQVAQEHGRLVVEVMARRYDGEPVIERHAIEEVALAQPTRRTAGTPGGTGKLLDAHPVLGGDVRDQERGTQDAGIGRGLLLRLLGVLADPQIDVEARGLIPEAAQHIPERQAVFPAGDDHEHAILSGEHFPRLDGALHLALEKLEKVRGTERGVVTANFQRRLGAAFLAAHQTPPPETTGRSSMVSSSLRSASGVSSCVPRITSTVSGLTLSSLSTARTLRRPAISISRFCCRIRTFMPPPPGA